MRATGLAASAPQDQASVVEDLSVFIVPGQVANAADAITEAMDAERLGFKTVWLCERFESVKEAGAIMGATAAVTTRLGVGTAPIVASSRLPLVAASMATTMQSLSGGRFTLGVGRGPYKGYFKGFGYSQTSYEALIDWCDILRRLWRGETVTYEGPAGSCEGIRLNDLPDGPPPKIMFCHLGGPKASKVAANPVFDIIMPGGLLTPEAIGRSIAQTKQECERIDRDPSELSFIPYMPSVPEMDEFEIHNRVTARLIMMFSLQKLYVELNGWDPKIVEKIMSQPILQNWNENGIDHAFNSPAGRASLLEVARQVPESWIRDVAAVGTASECVKTLQRFRDAGCDGFALYTATAAQNAPLIEAWRDHTAGEGS